MLIITLGVTPSSVYAVSIPTVETRPATSISQTAAFINGRIVNNGGSAILERRFDWGTTSSCADGWTANVGVSGDYFSYYLTGLNPGTTYYFRAWAKNSAGWGQGSVLSFTTSQAADTTKPTVNSLSVSPSSVTLGSSFTISYSVSDTGGSGLNRVELWRANDSGGSPTGWAEVKRTSASGNSYSGSFSDAPSSGGTYWYGIHAVDNASNWAAESSPVKVTVTAPTQAPVHVSPSNGATSVSLTPTFQWQAVSGATKYGLYVSKPPYGEANLVYENESVTGISLTLPSGILSEGITYRWNMRAGNAAGWGPFSSSWPFTTKITVSIPTVETRPATSISQTAAFINGRIVNNGGSAILERRFDWGTTSSCADGWTANVGVSGDYFAYYLTGLNPGTTYYFRAWAKNSAGWGQGSVLSFTTSPAVTIPTAPTLTDVVGTSNSVLLGWTDNSNNEDGFKVERKEGISGTYTQIGTTGANVNVYADSGLQFGKVYCYRVRAYNSAGNSGYSSQKCATTLSTPILSSPSNGATLNTNTVTLTWNPVTGADGYAIKVSKISCGEGDIFNGASISCQQQISNLANGVYYWQVQAAATTYPGLSAYSICRYFTIAVEPSDNPPTADFSADVTSCCAPLTVQFSDLSTAGDNPITSWYWDFGDGYTSTAENPSHTYDDGTYTVSLTVTDSHGCSDTQTKENYITANEGPTADFSADVTSCCEPITVQFADESTAGDNPIMSWYWDFGDGDTSTTQNPSHTYDTFGTYTVSLTVTDSHGCSDTATQAITACARPTATASSNSPVSQGATIQLYGGPDGMASYSWTGPGGWTSSLQNPTRPNATTAMAGTYTLVVTNEHGCSDDATTTVLVVVEDDTTPPTVSSVSPQNSDTDVDIDAVVTVTFSEAMDASTITAASFTLAGSAVSGTVTYDPATCTATFTPDGNLEYDHEYTARLSTAITDLAGNPLAEPYSWSFNTQPATQLLSIPVYTPIEQKAHKGTVLTYVVRVSNVASEPDTFVLSATDDFHWNIALAPTPTEELPPGGWTDVYVYVTVEESQNPNSIKIEAKSEKGLSEPATCALRASCTFPANIGLFAVQFIFSNTGKHPETLTFNAPSYAKLSSRCISLSPSESKWMNVVFNPRSSQDLYNTRIDVTHVRSGEEITISSQFEEYEIIATDFDMAVDSYKFENEIYGNEICYGMSETSILYFNHKRGVNPQLPLPGDKPNTYSLEPYKAEVMDEIEHHQECLTNHILAFQLMASPIIHEPTEYARLEYNLAHGYPMILCIGNFGQTESHAVVAYGIAKKGDNSHILVYDPDWDFTLDSLDWSLAFPYATYDSKSGQFYYFEPIRALVQEAHKYIIPIPTTGLKQFIGLYSPGELRVYDSQNRITGLVNGEAKQEIPDSIYDEENEIVGIFSVTDSYRYQVVGTEEGTYGLDIASIEGGEVDAFTATDIPITANATHQYAIDWDALSEGGEGVTVQVDSDGDGVFEDTVTADEELTQNEFLSQISGCFIATAAYGTPMAEEIQILREFRDEYLLTNPLGQALVDFYYKVSPPIAEFITEHPSLKPIVRAGLVPAVAMSTVAVNTTVAEKMAIVGLLALVSVALAVWAMRRRRRGPEYT